MKEVNYFSHDYGARNDPKLQEVMQELGLQGIGAFWCIIEQLYEQDGKLPLKSIKSIAFALHVECTIVERLINEFDLFVIDGEFFGSKSVNARLNKRKSISEARKIAAITRWKSVQEKQMDSNSNANAKQNYAIKVNRSKDIKEDISKDISKKNFRFSPPTLEEVKAYIQEKGYSVDADRWFNFYESKGWMIGKNKMKNWHAAITTWEKSENERNGSSARSRINKNCNEEWT